MVLVTTSGVEEAKQIAQNLLEKQLVACVNIVSNVHSSFCWKGKIEHRDESLMIIKSKSETFYKLVETVRGLHSYEIPEILAVPVQSGFIEYLTWRDQVIKPKIV